MLRGNGLKLTRWGQRLSLLLVAATLVLLSGCTTGIPPGPAPASATATPAVMATPDVLQTLEQRPLHLPLLTPGSRCPRTLARSVDPQAGNLRGPGPVYGGEFGPEDGELYYTDAPHFLGGGTDWGGAKTIWWLAPTFRGEALVRGHQIDGPHGMRFGSGLGAPYLVLEGLAQGWTTPVSYTRVQSPGCYAYQIDGITFSYLIIFQAVLMPVPGAN
jgi:hypothetical protein